MTLQLAWCSTEDIGGVAAAVIAGGPGEHGDKMVAVVGEHASVADVAAMFSLVFQKQVRGRVESFWKVVVRGK